MKNSLISILFLVFLFQINSQENQKFYLIFDESRFANSNFINFLLNRNSDSINIGLNIGEGEKWLIHYYFREGRFKFIDGEDLIGFKKEYYTNFLTPIYKQFDENLNTFICLDYQNTSIREKLIIISELGYFQDDMDNNFDLIDSLRQMNLSLSENILIKKTSYLLTMFRDSAIGTNLFRDNYQFVNSLIEEIDLIVKPNDQIFKNKYFSKKCENITEIVFLNPNSDFVNYLLENGKDVTIYCIKKSKRIKYLTRKHGEQIKFQYYKKQFGIP